MGSSKTAAAASPPPSSSSPSPSSHFLHRYLYSTRPWSFPITIAAIAIGQAAAYVHISSLSPTASPSLNHAFSIPLLLLTLLLGLLVHMLGNLINTLFDWISGLDKNKEADDRVLAEGIITEPTLRLFCWAVAGAILLNLLGFLLVLPSHVYYALFILSSMGFFLAFSYTSKPFQFKYRGGGDVCIFLAFGPLLVLGSYVAQTHVPLSSPLLPSILLFSIPIGLTTEGILHINNTRDMIIDKKHNALTLPQIIGYKGSYYLFIALYLISYSFCLYFLSSYQSYWYLLPFLSVPLAKDLIRDFGHKRWEDLCPRAGQFSTLFGLLLAAAILITGKNK